jgi:hypothetical protein
MNLLARKITKIIFYFVTSLIVGRTLGSPEIWFSHDLATRIAKLLYGDGDIGADNFYDLYFSLSVITVFSITTVIYMLTMKLIRKH